MPRARSPREKFAAPLFHYEFTARTALLLNYYTKSELAYPCGNLMRTPDVAACNVVAMAGSRGAAEARPRASARTRRPSLKARAQSAECEHANKPQAAGGARRGGRAAAPEGLRLLTPAPRKRPASDGGGGDGGDDTPKTGASHRAPSDHARLPAQDAAPWLQRATQHAASCQALYSSPLDGRQHGHTRARGHGSWHTHQ